MGCGVKALRLGRRRVGVRHLHTGFVRGQDAMVVEFRGDLVLKAHRLVYHSTLGSRVMKKKKSYVNCWDG